MATLWGPVLVVEDEPVLLDNLEKFLRQHNIIALKARSAEAALHILKGVKVHVIVCDNGLELTNGGLKLLDIVQQWYPETRRIIMTGALTDEVSAFAYTRNITAIQKGDRNSHTVLVEQIKKELGVG